MLSNNRKMMAYPYKTTSNGRQTTQQDTHTRIQLQSKPELRTFYARHSWLRNQPHNFVSSGYVRVGVKQVLSPVMALFEHRENEACFADERLFGWYRVAVLQTYLCVYVR